MNTTGTHSKPHPIAWLALLFLALLATPAAAEEAMSAESVYYGLNNLYLLVSAALVFWMHAGFACLEAGLTQAKNTVNILSKNVAIVALAGVSYYVMGFNLMYPGEFNGFLGFAGFGLAEVTPEGYADYSLFTDFIFQAVFAATAATIISGAVAERIKFHSFLIAALLFVTFVYPIAGSWKWGGGFLDAMGFYDFAGSTLVHSVGGWAALTGAIILGPRKGKYSKDGIKPIVGHSIPLATLGVFILFMGWFGFNGGSVLAMDSEAVSRVWVTTFLAGCAGGAAAMVTSWFVLKKPDITMMLNGMLAGLVGITAGSDVIMPWPSILVGAIAGALVVFAVVFIDQKLKVDDPVGAISVHLVCGIWGTLAVGIFSVDPGHTFMTQLIGVGAYGAFTLVTSAVIWFVLKGTIGIRVDEEEEVNGLDVAEHGLEAWPEFKSAT